MTSTAAEASIEIVDERELDGLQREWDDLLTRSYDNRLFLTCEWFRLWRRHFGSGEAAILVMRADDRVQGILPLLCTETEGTRTLTLLGDYNVSDYMDALAEKEGAEDILRRLWEHAISTLSWDRIELHHVPASSPLAAALASAGAEVTVEDEEVCPVAILCKDWDGYLQMLSKKQRHEIRRKLRRAQEGVQWDWRTARTVADLERDLPVFFRLHEASAHDKARFMTAPMRDFFRAVAHTYLEHGLLRLSIFSREGEDIATTMGFLYRDRYLLYNSGYNPDHAAHSPGIAAVAHAMQDAIAEEAVAFDFLSGDEAYKYQFGASNTHTCKITGTRR